MKYLEITAVAQLNEYFDDVESLLGDLIIQGRIELYSCKKAGSDKKLYKSLEQQYQVELSKSPNTHTNSELSASYDEIETGSSWGSSSYGQMTGTSPFGPLESSSSRRTLIDLISLLNASFPDYDFQKLKPEHFRKELNAYMVMNSINTVLESTVPNYNNEIAPKLWSTLETEIRLKECDIYSFCPDSDTDPYAEQGNIWSFNYFFYNKKLRRVVFVTFRAMSKLSAVSADYPDSDTDGPWTYADEMEV